MLCLEEVLTKGRGDVLSQTMGVEWTKGALLEKSFWVEYIRASVLPPDGGTNSGNDHRGRRQAQL